MVYSTRDYRKCEAQFCDGKKRIEELEAENAALKEHVADHQLLFKDYAAAQHRIKQLRDVIDSFSRTLAHNGSVPYRVCCGVADDLTHDKNCIAMKALALPDSTAELDAVMKDAARLKQMEHVANEWADMATNGLQWLRNIADGTSPVERALANMEECAKHCEEVRDAAMKGEGK